MNICTCVPLLALLCLAPQDPPARGRLELSYRVFFPADYKGDKKEDSHKVIDVISSRFASAKDSLQQPEVTLSGDDLLEIKIAGLKKTEVERYKRLLSAIGNLELRVVADKAAHDAYNLSKKAPPGYEAIPTDRKESEHGITDHVLAEKARIVTTEDVESAGAELVNDTWTVNFSLRDEAAKRFDDVAGKLVEMTPHGKIAIVYDKRLITAPTVNSASFKGSGQIQGGFDEDFATEMAIVLKGGRLPFPLGRRGADGKPVEKEPENERFVEAR